VFTRVFSRLAALYCSREVALSARSRRGLERRNHEWRRPAAPRAAAVFRHKTREGMRSGRARGALAADSDDEIGKAAVAPPSFQEANGRRSQFRRQGHARGGGCRQADSEAEESLRRRRWMRLAGTPLIGRCGEPRPLVPATSRLCARRVSYLCQGPGPVSRQKLKSPCF
jgi:hypothetical protein